MSFLVGLIQHSCVLCDTSDPHVLVMMENGKIHFLRHNLREKSVLQTTCPSIVPESGTPLGSVDALRYLSCAQRVMSGASHSLGILPCQILVILPQHFDCNDNKYNNIDDEDNGHR